MIFFLFFFLILSKMCWFNKRMKRLQAFSGMQSCTNFANCNYSAVSTGANGNGPFVTSADSVYVIAVSAKVCLVNRLSR